MIRWCCIDRLSSHRLSGLIRSKAHRSDSDPISSRAKLNCQREAQPDCILNWNAIEGIAMSCARTAVVLILGCLCATPACAQQDACQHRSIPVSVARNDDFPVPPLRNTNFEGTYRNKPVRITSAAISYEPPRVVLLLDVSGSMRDRRSESNWNFMVDIAEDLLSRMPAAAEVGLGFFSDELEPVASPTTDRKTLTDHLEGLRSRTQPIGRTALSAAILNSLKMFDGPHLGDIIYVITDGEENKSKVPMAQVAQILA